MNRLFAVVCLIAALAVNTSAWAPGTHAYIASKLERNANANDARYGAVAPDINQLLSTEQDSPFFYATHYKGPGLPGFMNMWSAGQAVGTRDARSLAFGFVSHNELWGADHYAHVASHRYPGFINSAYPGQNGYVWVKAAQLCNLMRAQLAAANLDDLGLLNDTMNCHFVVEYGMDLVLKGTRDPLVGQKLLNASTKYDQETMQALLVNAYGSALGPPMAFADPMWAGLMETYAAALNQPMNKAVPAVAAFLELLAERQLGTPEAAREQVTALIELGLIDSMALCAYDFNPEVDMTVQSVAINLDENGVVF